MHGLEDITIPTNLNSAYGPSPYDGLMSKHGAYFEDKEKYLKKWSDAMKCSEEEIFYDLNSDKIVMTVEGHFAIILRTLTPLMECCLVRG